MMRIINYVINDKRTNFDTFVWHSCQSFIKNIILRAAFGVTRRLFYLYNHNLKELVRSVVFLPVELIKKAEAENWLRSLGYFVRMKSLYVNNTHYRYNLRSLSSKLNCSPACLSFHIKELKSRGLVVEHSGNITFKGLKKISAIFGAKNIGVPVDHKNQLDLLRAQIIRFNLAQQEYNIKKSGVQKCPRHQTPNNFSERMNSCYVGLSAIGFGKLLGLSPAQGAAIRAKLIKMGILSSHRRFVSLFSLRGLLRRAELNTMKRQGLVPIYAKLREDMLVVEKRMELRYRA